MDFLLAVDIPPPVDNKITAKALSRLILFYRFLQLAEYKMMHLNRKVLIKN